AYAAGDNGARGHAMATRHVEILPARSAARRAGPGHETTSESRAQHPLLRLQRQAGNAAVSRFVQAEHDPALLQREAMPEEEEEELQMLRDPAAPAVGLEGGPVDAGLEQRIDAARGAGGGLPDGLKGSMENA